MLDGLPGFLGDGECRCRWFRIAPVVEEQGGAIGRRGWAGGIDAGGEDVCEGVDPRAEGRVMPVGGVRRWCRNRHS